MPSEDGSIIVATVGDELVGIVDGEEAWRWTPDVRGVGDVEMFDGYIGVEEHSYGWVNLAQFGRIDDDGVEPFDVFPEEFDFRDLLLDVDNAAAVGVLNQEPGFFTEGDLLTTIELRAGAPTHQAAEELQGSAAGAFGSYVYAATAATNSTSTGALNLNRSPPSRTPRTARSRPSEAQSSPTIPSDLRSPFTAKSARLSDGGSLGIRACRAMSLDETAHGGIAVRRDRPSAAAVETGGRLDEYVYMPDCVVVDVARGSS